jgi:hypothetical protein
MLCIPSVDEYMFQKGVSFGIGLTFNPCFSLSDKYKFCCIELNYWHKNILIGYENSILQNCLISIYTLWSNILFMWQTKPCCLFCICRSWCWRWRARGIFCIYFSITLAGVPCCPLVCRYLILCTNFISINMPLLLNYCVDIYEYAKLRDKKTFLYLLESKLV